MVDSVYKSKNNLLKENDFLPQKNFFYEIEKHFNKGKNILQKVKNQRQVISPLEKVR